MFATAQVSSSPFVSPRRRPSEVADILATVTMALHDVVTAESMLAPDDVARWCAAFGGVDPRLERAALVHAMGLVSIDVLIADIVACLRGRLTAAGSLLPALIECGGVPLVLATLGIEDAEPPAEALCRTVPARVARFYWQRLRAYVSWSASCAVTATITAA
jgi:hypothetical protein